MRLELANERSQMVARWSKVFGAGACWYTGPPVQLTRVTSNACADRSMAIRKLHDKLGFCAKGDLRQGGLCSGTIFRTGSFIALPQEQRSGARARQTVHIEHTVPVTVLAARLENRVVTGGSDADEHLAWLLKHSVTTAMRKGQDTAYFKGVTRSTTAFDSGSSDANKPLARYAELYADGETVWDVWNGVEVGPGDLTFDRHFAIILEVLRETGASTSFVHRLEAAA